MDKIKKKALVVFSGGQDSTTCLLFALNKYESVETISFDYGQRHKVELECVKNICKELGVKNTLLKTSIFEQIGDSALLAESNQDVNKNHSGNPDLPASFVPGRNIFFLTVASMYAYKKNIDIVITGVSQEDYSGYPDCRQITINSLQATLNLGLDRVIDIETPLINMSKTDEVEYMMSTLDGKKLLSMTHTCYNGKVPPCGECNSCKLRAKAFANAGYTDPLIERLSK